MIWFNIKSLEEKLINNKISEETGYHYLLTFLIFLSIAFAGNMEDDFSTKWWSLGDFLISLVILIFGLSKVFKINSSADNKDFLKRYFSLSFVHSLRIAIVLTILLILKKVLIDLSPNNISSFLTTLTKSDLAEFSANILISLLYYWLLIRSFLKVTKNKRLDLAAVEAS